jgi:hypothetical protein
VRPRHDPAMDPRRRQEQLTPIERLPCGQPMRPGTGKAERALMSIGSRTQCSNSKCAQPLEQQMACDSAQDPTADGENSRHIPALHSRVDIQIRIEGQ